MIRSIATLLTTWFFIGMSAPADAQSVSRVPASSERTVHGDPSDPIDVSDELKSVYRHIDQTFEDHVKRLQEWTQIGGVSNTVEGKPAVWESARFIRDLIRNELGCQADIYDPGLADWGAPGHPVVYGRCDVGADKTILDYIQGDVMPVWPEEQWPAPPFSGAILEIPPYKRVMVGKGVNNQKGKEMAQLGALIAIKRVTGTLPVNVIFLVDHDEERMELGPRAFMNARPELFADVDAVFGYAGSQVADGRGEIVGMSFGCVVFELETSLPREGLWVHQQPVWRQARMLSTLFDEASPLMKELSAKVWTLSPDEDAFFRREVEHNGGAVSYGELIKRRTSIRTTFTGIWGGNMAPGFAGNLRTPVATVKVDMRYPPGLEGEDVLAAVRSHLDREGFQDVKITPIGIVPWSWANADNEIGEAIKRMYRQFNVPFNEPPPGNYIGTWTGYGPPYLFTRGPLEVPVGRGGLGYGWGSHFGPQGEFYVIEGDGEKIYGFAGAMKSAATVLYNYAGKNPEP